MPWAPLRPALTLRGFAVLFDSPALYGRFERRPDPQRCRCQIEIESVANLLALWPSLTSSLCLHSAAYPFKAQPFSETLASLDRSCAMATGAICNLLIARVQLAGLKVDAFQEAPQDTAIAILQAVWFLIFAGALVMQEFVERLHNGADPIPAVANRFENL